MYNLKKILPIINDDQKIFHAINKITKSKIKILFVVDKKKKTFRISFEWRFKKVNRKKN